MIDIVSDEDVRRLAGVGSKYCVSIYLPTHPAGPDVAQDPIRMKNLVNRARSELHELGLRSPDATELLRPVEELIVDAQFLAHLQQGLALFVSEGAVERFRLPGPVDETVMVSDRLLLSPLLRFVVDGGFHLLTLSENEVRLMRGTRYGVSDIDTDLIPGGLAEALRFDDRESQVFSHGADRVGTGQVSAGFHGHGVASDFDDVDRGRFLRAVEAGLERVIGGSSDPLVLAGTEEIVSQFRNLSRYRHIVDGSVGGSPEHLSRQELHERAWSLAGPRLSTDRLDAWRLLRAESPKTVGDVADAVVAAARGRVAHLLVAIGVHRWGSFDADTEQVDEHVDRALGDHDLLNLAVIETLRHGGDAATIDASEMPTDGPIAAVLRF